MTDVETSILMNYDNIFIDACFINRKARKRMMKLIQKTVILKEKVEHQNKVNIIALIFEIPLWKAIWRDLWRKKRVGFKVIWFFRKRYQAPSFDEGFHIILTSKHKITFIEEFTAI